MIAAEHKNWLADPASPLHKSPKGYTCTCVNLDNGWGVKVYYNKYERDLQHTRQTEAAKHGLGPNVGPHFEFQRGPHRMYAFVTEMVDMAEEDSKFVNQWGYWSEEGQEALALLRYNLGRTMQFSFVDDAPFNCGVKDGKLICIDFGC